MTEIAKILKTFPLFREFSDTELTVLGATMRERRFEKGEYLFREGDAGTSVFFLFEGAVVADKLIDPDTGARKDLAMIAPGAFFGELAIIDGSPRSAGIRAEINVQALELERERFDALLAAHPYLGYKLLKTFFSIISHRLKSTNEELVSLYDVGKIVSSVRQFRPLVHIVLRRIIQRLEASYGIMAMLENGRLRVDESTGLGAKSRSGDIMEMSHALIQHVFENKKPLLVERFRGITEPWESESMILAPLIASEKLTGVLLLGIRTDGTPYTGSDLNLVAAVANVCSPAIEMARTAETETARLTRPAKPAARKTARTEPAKTRAKITKTVSAKRRAQKQPPRRKPSVKGRRRP